MNAALVQQRVDFMGRVPLLRRLNVEERTELVYELREQQFARGEQIIVEGDVGSEMFIVEEGEAAAYVKGAQTPGKPPGEVARYTTGDFFGEQALITNKPRGATVVATTPVLTLTLGQEAFHRLVGDVGAVMQEARRRLRAASYVKGRRDYKKLFHYYNRSRSGVLDWSEFRALIRKDGRMTAALMTERELRTLFCMVDFKGNGYIDEHEFLQFVQVPGEDDQHAEAERHEALTSAELARRIDLLRKVKILRSLTTGECRALAKALTVRDCAAGQNVITAGEAGNEMFIVQEGELEAISEDETTHYVDYHPGGSFGELALLSNAPRSATVRALSDCTLLRLRRRTFDALVGNVGACMEELRRRFRAAAYVSGRLDYAKLFAQYDRWNSGSLAFEEFNAAVRKYGHVSTKVATNREVQVLFDMIDLDGNCYISREEFYTFLGLTKDGQPKAEDSAEERHEAFSYHLSLDDVELRLKEIRKQTYEKHHGRAKACRSHLGSRSQQQPQPEPEPQPDGSSARVLANGRTSSSGGGAQTPPRTAEETSIVGAPAMHLGRQTKYEGHASSHGEQVRTMRTVRAGNTELSMPAEQSANAPAEDTWLPVSHAAVGQVPIAENLWGARRRELPDFALSTPPAGASSSWAGDTGAEETLPLTNDTSADTIPANAEASLTAWGSTVRFTPAPNESAHDGANDAAGRMVSNVAAKDVSGVRDTHTKAAAEARYAAVWGVMSPTMRTLAVAEERQRWGGDSGRSDTPERGSAIAAVHGSSSARSAETRQADALLSFDTPARSPHIAGATTTSASVWPASTSRTLSSCLSERTAERLDRRYTKYEMSRIESGHMPE